MTAGGEFIDKGGLAIGFGFDLSLKLRLSSFLLFVGGSDFFVGGFELGVGIFDLGIGI